MKRQRGFIEVLLIIILALALLKYFLDWSIFDILDSEKGKATVEYIRDILTSIWNFIRGLFR